MNVRQRLFPASLATRTVLLVVAVVAIAEYATFSLISHTGRNAHMRQTTQLIAGQIRLLQTVLPGLDAEARRHLENTDIGEQWLQLRPDDDAVPPAEPPFGFGRRGFTRQLSWQLKNILGEPVLLRHQGPEFRNGLWIGFMVGSERWWLVLPPPRLAPPGMPPDFWLWLGANLLVLVLIAGLFVRGIVRPLARLGEAVTATGDGSARTVIPEGPREVRRLAEQHNTMLAQLASADAERREMLAGLTHDLRAPLARLRVRLALLEESSERDGLRRDSEDMERIVGQCLDFLRCEKTSAAPPPPLNLADALSDEIARQRELGRPLEIAVSEAAAGAFVAIGHGNLQRLLDNLIDNALQYGAPPIEISLTLDSPQTVCLRIRDHGNGIPAAQRQRALEAFAQIEPARATGGSCGLGLAIVRRIVTACGGSLSLDEAPGGGLEVALRLPLAR